MTANTTPRQGLMAPVDSDLFLSADFSTTFTKLDSVPGTTIVPNYAALTALNWGTNQHGSKVIQADTGAEWMWSDPSASGTWKRTNSIGLLKYSSQSAPVSTSIKTTGPTFIDTGNFTVPGGRPVEVHLSLGADNSSGVGGIVIITLLDNLSQVGECNYRVGSPINSHGCNVHMYYYMTAPANASTHRITAQIRSANLSAGVGGSGTSVARVSNLIISEM